MIFVTHIALLSQLKFVILTQLRKNVVEENVIQNIVIFLRDMTLRHGSIHVSPIYVIILKNVTMILNRVLIITVMSKIVIIKSVTNIAKFHHVMVTQWRMSVVEEAVVAQDTKAVIHIMRGTKNVHHRCVITMKNAMTMDITMIGRNALITSIMSK
jgi:hypothetical protein